MQNHVVISGYECRDDALVSSLLGKSVQHVHRYAAFIQTIELGFNICGVYLGRFERFPSSGAIDETYVAGINDIFNEMFNDRVDASGNYRQFFISDDVVTRAIDLVSGLLQQMKILMDDSNAPTWNGSLVRSVVVMPINNDQTRGKTKGKKKKEQKKGKQDSIITY